MTQDCVQEDVRIACTYEIQVFAFSLFELHPAAESGMVIVDFAAAAVINTHTIANSTVQRCITYT